MSRYQYASGNVHFRSIVLKFSYCGHSLLQYLNRRHNRNRLMRHQQGLYQSYMSLKSKQTQGLRRSLKVTLLKPRITLFRVHLHSYSSKASSSLVSSESNYHFNCFGVMSESDLHKCYAVLRFSQTRNNL